MRADFARRLEQLCNHAEVTVERHLLNGIQGVVHDPRGGAVVVNYVTEFSITPAAEIDFDNATPASGAMRKRCQEVLDDVEEDLGGRAVGAASLRAECGSAFFADLVAHEVRETYLNTAAATAAPAGMATVVLINDVADY